MKVIVAGAAEVGTHLAKLLAREKLDVTLIDENPDRLRQLTFINIMTLEGNPTSIQVLKEAGAQKADLFIAVTPNESINIHACILAANLGARKTVARVDNYETQKKESSEFYKQIGITDLIYPEMLGGQAVASAIMRPWARLSHGLCDDHLLLLCVKVYKDTGAPIIGMSMADVGRNYGQFHVAAIKRGDELIIPNGADVIEAGDLIYFITTPDKANFVRLACGKKDRRIKRVIFMGGTRLGIQSTYFLRDLNRDIEFTFINNGRAEAENLMEKVPGANVISGDTTALETMTEIQLGPEDALVALGDNSGSNVLACLTAKKLGVGKTVVEVEDVDYIALAENLNIGSTVNKKMLAASCIYQMLLNSDKTSAKCFSLIDAEVADLVAQPGSKITQRTVAELGLSRNVTLGGFVRDGVGYNVIGSTRICPGDHVVVVCLNEKISQVEKLFS